MIHYIFHRLTKYRFAKNAQKIKWAVKHKNWARAAKLAKNVDKKDHTWLHKHVFDSFRNDAFFAENILDKKNTCSRILKISKDFQLIRSKPLYGGMVSTGIYAHEVAARSGEKNIIVEKIYDKKFKKHGILEAMLFEETDHQRLCAPRFLGFVDGNDYFSVFSEYVKTSTKETLKRKLFFDRQKNLIERLVIFLWGSKPSKELLSKTQMLSATRLALIEEYLNKENIKKLYAALDSRKDKQLTEMLLCEHAAYIKKFNQQPAFIMHGDLNNLSNVIVQSNGHPVIIDWDKWYVSHIGGGLRIKPRAFLNSELSNKIDRFCANNPHVHAHDVWANVAIDNLANCLNQNDWGSALEWAKHLAGISKD